MGHRRGCDHGIVGSSRGLATGAAQRSRHSPERTRCLCIEWQGIEIGLRLLDVSLTGSSLLIGGCH